MDAALPWHAAGRGRRRGARRRGLTLIEILIVVVILGILSLIVLPRFFPITRKGLEASLRGNLNKLRTAIEQFDADTGAYPPALEDLMAVDGAAISADADGAGHSVDRTAYEGPYLRTPGNVLPKDPITRAVDWNYDNSAGTVHSSSTLTALDGSDYSTW